MSYGYLDPEVQDKWRTILSLIDTCFSATDKLCYPLFADLNKLDIAMGHVGYEYRPILAAAIRRQFSLQFRSRYHIELLEVGLQHFLRITEV